MDILGSLPKNKQVNQFIVMTTDRYTKLAKAIPTAKAMRPQYLVSSIRTGSQTMVFRLSSSPITALNLHQNSSWQCVTLSGGIISQPLNTAYNQWSDGTLQRSFNIAITSLRVQKPDRLARIFTYAYIRLQRASTKVCQDVSLQLDVYVSPPDRPASLQDALTYQQMKPCPRPCTPHKIALNGLRFSAKKPTKTYVWGKGDIRRTTTVKSAFHQYSESVISFFCIILHDSALPRNDVPLKSIINY